MWVCACGEGCADKQYDTASVRERNLPCAFTIHCVSIHSLLRTVKACPILHGTVFQSRL